VARRAWISPREVALAREALEHDRAHPRIGGVPVGERTPDEERERPIEVAGTRGGEAQEECASHARPRVESAGTAGPPGVVEGARLVDAIDEGQGTDDEREVDGIDLAGRIDRRLEDLGVLAREEALGERRPADLGLFIGSDGVIIYLNLIVIERITSRRSPTP